MSITAFLIFVNFSLAIIVMIVLISCNDMLKSRCYFIGFPWSTTKVYYHETIADEEFELLLVGVLFSFPLSLCIVM